MAQSVTTRVSRAPGTAWEMTTKTTRALLACGLVAGPLFMVAAMIQAFTRPGFDLTRHAISMLSLGDLGWIQNANFIVTGLLAVAFAVGIRLALRPGRADAWGPLLIGVYGVGMVTAGLFHPDPGLGFPPGSPAGMPAVMSGHATVHSIAFFMLGIALITACFVFVRRFVAIGERGWAAYCAATGVAAPALIVLGSTHLTSTGVTFAVMGAVTSGWIAAIAARLLRESDLTVDA